MITIDPIKRPSKGSSSVNTEEIMKETVSKLSELESKTVELENQLVDTYTKSEIDNMIIFTLNTEV